MKTDQFDYSLPAHLIAQQPLNQRRDSRLLEVLPEDYGCHDRWFKQFPDLLRPGDLLVFNDTQVIPARLYGHKQTGGKVELLIERILPQNRALCHIKASKAPGAGVLIELADGSRAEVLGREGDLFKVSFSLDQDILAYLSDYGHMPLPPYIEREDQAFDWERYQTVYAQKPGAVAAPTAGLHFDQGLIEQIKAKGIKVGYVTLHVGAGTFQPVRVEQIEDHKMHAEWFELDETLSEAVVTAKQSGGRVIAVGTTVVRSLETVAQGGQIKPFQGETSIFITPGFQFQCVDALLTNFHLPCSTLLMLVCAFAGYDTVMQAYRHAIEAEYRFYSYGDAMFIQRSGG